MPWRLGLDAIVNGEARARTAVGKIETWLRGATGAKPASIVDGYKLDGTKTGTDPELAFVAPAMVGAMLDITDRAWLRQLVGALISTRKRKTRARNLRET